MFRRMKEFLAGPPDAKKALLLFDLGPRDKPLWPIPKNLDTPERAERLSAFVPPTVRPIGPYSQVVYDMMQGIRMPAGTLILYSTSARLNSHPELFSTIYETMKSPIGFLDSLDLRSNRKFLTYWFRTVKSSPGLRLFFRSNSFERGIIEAYYRKNLDTWMDGFGGCQREFPLAELLTESDAGLPEVDPVQFDEYLDFFVSINRDTDDSEELIITIRSTLIEEGQLLGDRLKNLL